ncbi:MAG: PilX N-terminal domain-containing pilus assembly protein [Polaromonas sp.]
MSEKIKTEVGYLASTSAAHLQNGVSLIIVMIVLTVVSLLGVAGIQISSLAEKSARNDRDLQIAMQAAEAALLDAEFDIIGPGSSTRRAVFDDDTAFVEGCGTAGNSRGLCLLRTAPNIKPAWLTVDFTVTGNNAATTEFGAFTGRSFASGTAGIQPSKLPRYVIEPMNTTVGASEARSRDEKTQGAYKLYRITAMGFGPRDDIQAVLQAVLRHTK